MYIIHDFNEILEGNAKHVIKRINSEKDELSKQLHLVLVLDATYKLQHLIDSEILSELNLYVLNVIQSSLYGELEYEIDKNISKFKVELKKKIDDIFQQLSLSNGFNSNFISDEFKNKISQKIILNNNFSTKFTKLLLCKELQITLTYAKMQYELIHNKK